MKKVYILPEKACDHRSLDAEKISKYLSKNNYKIVNKPKDADIIIFLPCAAFNVVAEKAFRVIKKFQKYNAELIVAGCLPELDKEELSKFFKGKTITTQEILKNPDKMDQFFPGNKIKFKEINDANTFFRDFEGENPIFHLKNFMRKSRWLENKYVKVKEYVLEKLVGKQSHLYLHATNRWPTYHVRIAWGCLGNCAYCAIKKAIGPLHSKPFDQCIKEFKRGLEKGYKNIVITADDTTVYGLDISSSFPKLLDEITKIPGDYKLYIRNVHPQWLVKYIDDLERIFKRQKIKFVECSIDSYNSRILKLMNRYSDPEKIKDAMLRLKKACPDLSLFTHIIVGFPTETDEEFKQNLLFITGMEISAGFIFPFCCRKGTKVEQIEPKLPEKVISKRIQYAKSFMKKSGYNVIYQNEKFPFSFSKKV